MQHAQLMSHVDTDLVSRAQERKSPVPLNPSRISPHRRRTLRLTPRRVRSFRRTRGTACTRTVRIIAGFQGKAGSYDCSLVRAAPGDLAKLLRLPNTTDFDDEGMVNRNESVKYRRVKRTLLWPGE